MATLHPRVILVYNADGTTLGKLRYGYKKLFGQRSEGESACGNCEVTHGGLRLTETDAWRDAKKTMESSMGLVVQQLHRDELDERMRKIVETTRLPTVLYDDGTKMEEIVGRDVINACALVKSADTQEQREQTKAQNMVDAIERALSVKAPSSNL